MCHTHITSYAIYIASSWMFVDLDGSCLSACCRWASRVSRANDSRATTKVQKWNLTTSNGLSISPTGDFYSSPCKLDLQLLSCIGTELRKVSTFVSNISFNKISKCCQLIIYVNNCSKLEVVLIFDK